MNIVIMGATSHIAKGLIERLLARGDEHLYLFSRSEESVQNFLGNIGQRERCNYSICGDYQAFKSFSYDVIINCIGVETRNKHNCDFTRYFSVTEEFDNLAISYLKERNRNALYISFSSGAVYGKGFSEPVNDDAVNALRINHIAQEDYYSIARINAEAKHRAHGDLNIVDLRIFSYFSRHINLNDGYFITDVIQALLNNEVLITDDNNIVRDYLHPDDLLAMILCCVEAGRLNRAFDVNSSRPASKQDILDHFTREYGLRYEIRQILKTSPATGAKTNYYSTNRDASQIGYRPRFSSLGTLEDQARPLLSSIIHRKKELTNAHE